VGSRGAFVSFEPFIRNRKNCMDIHEIALLLFLLVITEVTVWFGLVWRVCMYGLMDGVCGLASGDWQRDWAFCNLWSPGFRVLSRDRRGPTTQKTCFDDGDGVDRGARCPMPTRSFVSISALNGRSFFSVILFFFDGFVPFFSAKDKNISLPRPPSLPFTF